MRDRTAEIGIRRTSEEVGLSHGGLHGFLGGTVPHAATATLLLKWYLERSTAAEGGATAMAAAAALDLLTSPIASRRSRGALRLRILQLVEEALAKDRTPPPGWLAALRDEPKAKPKSG